MLGNNEAGGKEGMCLFLEMYFSCFSSADFDHCTGSGDELWDSEEQQDEGVT